MPKATSRARGRAAVRSRARRAGPAVGVRALVVQAVSGSTERSGMSLSAMKKALSSGGYNVAKNNSRIKAAVKALVGNQTLVQIKGTGASGSFKLNPAGPKRVAARRPASRGRKSASRARKSPMRRVAKSPKRRAAKSPKRRPARRTPVKRAPAKRAAVRRRKVTSRRK